MNTFTLPINIKKICRICLKESEELHSIFNVLQKNNCEQEDVIYVYEMLMNVSSIKILSDDNIPTTLCTTCMELVNRSYKFQQQCNRSQVIWETYFIQINRKENVAESSIVCEASRNPDGNCSHKTNFIDRNHGQLECLEDSFNKAKHMKNVSENINSTKIKNKGTNDVEVSEEYVQPEKRILSNVQNETIPKLQRKKVYPCSLCDKTYKFATSLKVHMRTHTLERPHICSLCGKDFKQYGSLTHHSRIHSGEQPYKCKLCDKKYKQSGSLITHMRVHTGQRPFLCSVCGRGFRQAPDLGYHMRTHTKEKPYMCSICGKTMSMQCHLVQHMRSHTGERPFKCTECDKSFPSSTRLKRHAIIHTGLKPYKCEVCGRSFNRKSALCVHAKIHTDDRPHVCTVCGKGFIQSHSLRSHTATHC